MKDQIIFWIDLPPKVEKGAFNYLSKVWPEKVYYVLYRDLPAFRKTNGWDDNDYGNAIIIKLWEFDNIDLAIEKICNEHKEAINILNGFTNEIQIKVRKYLFKNNAKIGGYTERPNYNGNCVEKFIRNSFLQFRYRRLAYLYKNHIDFVLPLGKKGVDAFAKYGWDKNKLFQFMYNPNIDTILKPTYREGGPVRFVYVGRFYYKTKGVDTLMSACNRLSGDWSIDLVGGYGTKKDEVLKWISNNSHANFLGSWEAKDVVPNINKYDVVIVPSNFDGWNLLVNESIYASTGIIVSTEAVSDEMIEKSKSGYIFKAKSAESLRLKMQSVIDDPHVINEWKDNAHKFVNNITETVVGQYLVDILNYTYYEKKDRPICPWSL